MHRMALRCASAVMLGNFMTWLGYASVSTCASLCRIRDRGLWGRSQPHGKARDYFQVSTGKADNARTTIHPDNR